MSIEKLIARLDAANKGSRDLDYRIAQAIGNKWMEGVSEGESPPFAPRSIADRTIPGYTTKVDGALTLVPENARVRELGQWWDVSRPGGWFCSVARWEYDNKLLLVERYYTYGFADDDRMPKTAPTAALAVCIAALKARSKPVRAGEIGDV